MFRPCVEHQKGTCRFPVLITNDLCYVYILVDFAVNLAVALANKCHLKVGLLDADVYGPSVPTMMKISKKPDVTQGNYLISEVL